MEQQEALEQIKLIREMMHKASQKFFFSPWQWIEWGVVVLIGGFLSHLLIGRGDTTHISTVWISVFIVGATLEGVAWILDAQRRGVDPFSPFVLKIWGALGCILLPGIFFTIILVQLHLSIYIVGLWLITTGSAMFMIVLLGERKELFLFGLVMLVCGIASASIFIDQALHIGVFSFGLGSLIMGVYVLIKEKKQK
jgi:hypothetical protein